MSSILKALKKLEKDNASSRREQITIDKEILRECQPSRLSPVKGALLAVLLFAGGSGVTYLFLNTEPRMRWEQASKPSFSGGVDSTEKYTVIPPHSQEKHIPVEHISPEPIVVASPSETMRHNKGAVPKTSVLVTSHAVSGVKHPSPRCKSSQSDLPRQQGHHNSVSDQTQVTASSQITSNAGTPVLKVNGIAFQEGLDSVAVVNGVPVSKGSIIEGVRVTEIQKDRVQFSHQGTAFEVSLGKSNY